MPHFREIFEEILLPGIREEKNKSHDDGLFLQNCFNIVAISSEELKLPSRRRSNTYTPYVVSGHNLLQDQIAAISRPYQRTVSWRNISSVTSCALWDRRGKSMHQTH